MGLSRCGCGSGVEAVGVWQWGCGSGSEGVAMGMWQWVPRAKWPRFQNLDTLFLSV